MARCDATVTYMSNQQDAGLVDIGAIEVQDHLAGGVAAAEAETRHVSQADGGPHCTYLVIWRW